jgi:hypothetical protein
VQEQREDCGSENWGGLPRREEEGCRNNGGSVVAGEGLRRNTRRGKQEEKFKGKLLR